MAFPETGIGIYPGLGGTQRTPRRIGRGLAKWLIYTGKMIGAKEALAIGLVDAVVPTDQLDATIHEAIDAGIGAEAAEKAPLPDEFKSLQSFFGNNSAEAMRSGEASTGENALLASAVKAVGFKAPIALRLAEKLIDQGAKVELREGLDLELEHLTEIFSTADAYEGLSSLGKRRPVYKGQ